MATDNPLNFNTLGLIEARRQNSGEVLLGNTSERLSRIIEAPDDVRTAFVQLLSESMGPPDFVTEITPEDKKTKIKGYLKETRQYFEEAVEPDDLQKVVAFMQASKANAGLLLAKVLFGDEHDQQGILSQQQSDLIKLLGESFGVKSKEITGKIIEYPEDEQGLVQLASFIGKNYPIFAANNGRPSLLGCIEKALESIESMESEIAPTARNQIIEEVRLARPLEKIETREYSNEDYRRLSSLTIYTDVNPNPEEKGFIQDFDQFMWRTLDPENGYYYSTSDEQDIDSRGKMLNGLVRYMRENSIVPSPEQRSLFMLAITHESAGILSSGDEIKEGVRALLRPYQNPEDKRDGAVLELVGFTAELLQADGKYSELFQEYAADNAEGFIQDHGNEEGKEVSVDVFNRWVVLALCMNLGLNRTNESFLNSYFDFGDKFADKQVYDGGFHVLNSSGMILHDSYEKRRGTKRGFMNEIRKYKPIIKPFKTSTDTVDIVGDNFLGDDEGLQKTYIERSLGLARATKVHHKHEETIFNLIASRAEILNLDEDAANAILSSIVEFDQNQIGSDITQLELPQDSIKFYEHLYRTIGVDENDIYEIFNSRNYIFRIDLKFLEEQLGMYKRRKETRQGLAQTMVEGVDGLEALQSEYDTLMNDPEFAAWLERKRTEFKELLNPAVRELAKKRENHNGHSTFANDEYVHDYLGFVFKRFAKEHQLYDGDNTIYNTIFQFYSQNNIQRDELWELVDSETQVSSLADLVDCLICNGKYVFPYDGYLTEKGLAEFQSNNLPRIRELVTIGIPALDEDHPIREFMRSKEIKINDVQLQLEEYHKQIVEDEDRKMKGKDFKDLKLLMDSLLSFGIISSVIEKDGIQLEETDGELIVEGGTSPRLERLIGRTQHEYRGVAEQKARIRPHSVSVMPGGIVALGAPVGAGKTAFVEAAEHNVGIAMRLGWTTARRVGIPRGIKLTSQLGNYSVRMRPDQSLFMNTARHLAEQSTSVVHFGDEELMGAPASFRIAILAATYAIWSQSGDYNIFASHQTAEITEILRMLGFGENMQNKMLNPNTHVSSDGISESYGMKLLEALNAPVDFVELMDLLEVSRQQNFNDVGLDRIRNLEVNNVKGELDEGLSEQTIESAGLKDCLYAMFKDVFGDSNGGVFLQTALRNFRSTNESIEDYVEKYENMNESEIQAILMTLSKTFAQYEWINNMKSDIDDAGKVSEEKESWSPLNNGEWIKRAKSFANIITVEENPLTPEDENVLRIFFSDEFIERYNEIESLKQKVAQTAPTGKQKENLSKYFNGRGSTEVEKLRRYLYKTNSSEDYDVIENESVDKLVERFYITFFNDPSSAKWGEDIFSKELFINAFEPIVKVIRRSMDSKDKKGKKHTDRFQESLENAKADEVLGLTVARFGRSGNDENPYRFVKPKEADGPKHASLTFKGGINLSLIGKLNSADSYIPQDYYHGEGHHVESHIEFFTGLQGGGKTAKAELILQEICYLLRFNRVLAKEATVYSRPTSIVGVIRKPETQGMDSTFTGEAKRLIETIKAIHEGTLVVYDEPANGTSDRDREIIIAALAIYAWLKGATIKMTNHENGVYSVLGLIDQAEGIEYSTLGYTLEKREDFSGTPGLIAGAESFTVAQEMGITPNTINLAEYIDQTRKELENHKKRVFA